MQISFPEKFLNKLRLLTGESFDQAIESFNHPSPVSFRVNTLKAERGQIIEELRTVGFLIESIPWYEDAFILKNKAVKDITGLSLYQEGKVYIQNLSSMIPVLALDPKRGEKVLDIAAAPGSKTTQMAALMSNSGEIVANDISRARLYKLDSILKQYGATNTIITNFPGQVLWQKYPEYFDKTLVDAPCSMEGRFKTYDPKTYKDWNQKKVKILSQQQKYLLYSAVSATKQDGVIVYSTCTLSPEENEEVIDWVLQKTKGSIQIEEIHIPKLNLSAGVVHWSEKQFDRTLEKTARIFPSGEMEGFYVAKLRKVKSNITNRENNY